MIRHQKVIARFGPDDAIPGSDDVRLNQVIVMLLAISIRRVATSRPARTVRSNLIIRALISAESICSADGEGRRLVAGRVNLSVQFIALRILSVVARRR